MNFNIMKPIYNAVASLVSPGYRVLGLSMMAGKSYYTFLLTTCELCKQRTELDYDNILYIVMQIKNLWFLKWHLCFLVVVVHT